MNVFAHGIVGRLSKTVRLLSPARGGPRVSGR